MLNSNYSCAQTLGNNIIKEVTCIEQQRVELADQIQSQITSTVTLYFKAIENSAQVKPVKKFVPQNLFISADFKTEKKDDESAVKTLLSKICAHVEDSIEPQVLTLFPKFVSELKSLSNIAYKNIVSQLKSGQICSSPKLNDLFLGASSVASDENSIMTLVTSYINGETSETFGSLYFSLMALSPNPNEKSLQALLPLLKYENVSRQIILAISSILYNFCEERDNCGQMSIIQEFSGVLIDKIKKFDGELDVITAIKALDNIDIESNSLAKEALLSLVVDKQRDDGVRSAAIIAISKVADINVKQVLNVTIIAFQVNN